MNMTIETWKAEFYPLPAKACPVEQAVEHSLQKWRGLRAEAISKHELYVRNGNLYNKGEQYGAFIIGSGSCALCQHFYDEDGCERCPLAISRNGVPCDNHAPDEPSSPWWRWGEGNPEPMIAALEKALAAKPEAA